MRSNKRLSALALVVVAAGLSLTACDPNSTASGPAPSSDSAGTAASAGSSSATSAPSAASGQDGSSGSGSRTSSSNGSSASGGSGNASSGSGSSHSGSASGSTCKTANLAITTQHGISGEGQEVVNFRNNASTSCTMQGYAGVDLRGKGDTDGVSATRGGSSERPLVTLGPGDSTQFVVNYPVNKTGGSGYTFTTMTITPPDETHSKQVSTSINIGVGNPDSDSKSPGIVIYAVGTGK
ncbi:DUF4232 domain-containing protein [Streptomyces sp. SID10853]|uniref:DUF4232 domain-containing protein n=1 Tax=Streptomyces sp. SID10853 TaxID=2706028 RepID=UPI0013C02399|nr:DUF4232 domain-containing protein [Streptomyces sp. SID10853]NDZ77692.1 DUF4232 domain-containing protein [Streptomyces sp. SID10853]